MGEEGYCGVGKDHVKININSKIHKVRQQQTIKCHAATDDIESITRYENNEDKI